MKETWISNRRRLQVPGLLIERHTSTPNELDFAGHHRHLLCLLLSNGNRQQMTRIGELQSEKFQVRRDYWICPAGESGRWVWQSTDESLMFAVDPLFLARTAEEVGGLATERVELLATVSARDPEIDAIARLFELELDAGGLGGPLYVESLVQVFAIHLLRQHCAFHPEKLQDAGPSALRLQAVLEYIQSRLDQPLHLAEFAKISGLSQYHFCRWFKRSTGTAPYQYVLQKRMERAKQLLQQSHYSVAEIAQLVGCSDQSRFARHFKKRFGVAPGSISRKMDR